MGSISQEPSKILSIRKQRRKEIEIHLTKLHSQAVMYLLHSDSGHQSLERKFTQTTGILHHDDTDAKGLNMYGGQHAEHIFYFCGVPVHCGLGNHYIMLLMVHCHVTSYCYYGKL